MQNYRISATGHSVNYLPEYVASWKGLFADENLVVSATVPSPWGVVLSDLGTGSADAALGGIWVPSMYFGRGKRYTPFAQIAARSPMAIIGRNAPEAFAWSDMAGKVIALGSGNGASVGLFTKMLLREHGVDPKTVGFVQDLDGKMLAELFAGGMGDFLVTDYPSAIAFEAKGYGRVVAPLAVAGGNVPWSVYYTEGEPRAERVETQVRFVRALKRAMDWINANDAAGYGEFLASTFPRFERSLLVTLVNVYRANGMWTTPMIDRDAFARWQGGIAEGHLTAAPIPYETLIDTRVTASFATA